MTTPAALDHSLRVLACPYCGDELGRVEQTLRCGRGHAFDLARAGYAPLTTGSGPHHSGDTADMVAARAAFLGRGHYEPIAQAIADVSPQRGWCVELAGGTGYYAAHVLDAAPDLDGVTLDVSKYAARAATRAHPRLASITGDARAVLPFRTGGADLVLSVFGPRRGDEVARILAPGGSAIVVTPRASHLVELRERFGLLTIGADKEDRLHAAMAPLALAGSENLEYVMSLTADDVVNAIMMGPNAFHRGADEIDQLAESIATELSTTVSVTVSRFRVE
jgi:23S rRNA (guanine745-N1)-methyltransferase